MTWVILNVFPRHLFVSTFHSHSLLKRILSIIEIEDCPTPPDDMKHCAKLCSEARTSLEHATKGDIERELGYEKDLSTESDKIRNSDVTQEFSTSSAAPSNRLGWPERS